MISHVNVSLCPLAAIPRKENGTFERAIGEIKAGRKSSCWMWFVIPSPPHMKNNVEHGSSMNRKYLDISRPVDCDSHPWDVCVCVR